MRSLGFQKYTVIKRASYQTMAFSTKEDVATYFKDEQGIQINENQELLDNWEISKKDVFVFYQTKFKQINIPPLIDHKSIDRYQEIALYWLRMVKLEQLRDIIAIIVEYSKNTYSVNDEESVLGVQIGNPQQICCCFQFDNIWFISATNMKHIIKHKSNKNCNDKNDNKSSKSKPKLLNEPEICKQPIQAFSHLYFNILHPDSRKRETW